MTALDAGQADPAGALATELSVAQGRLLMRQMPVALAANVVGAIIVGAEMAEVVAPRAAWGWTGLVLLATGGRTLLWMKQRRQPVSPENAGAYLVPPVVGAGLSGMLWGIGSVWLFPEGAPHQMFLAFVVGAMAAGSVMTIGAVRPAFYAFVLPATVPLATRFLLVGTGIYIALGLMGLVFVGAVTLAGFHVQAVMQSRVRLRLRLAARDRELARVSERLAAATAERREIEGALQRLQQLEAADRLAAGVAHDFNNLLTAIIGSQELILGTPGAPERVLQHAGTARHAAARGARLLEQRLRLSRAEPGPADTVRVDELLESAAPLLRQAAGRQIVLRIAGAADAWPVHVDAAGLEAAILNLVLNARDAMDGRGEVAIEARNVALAAGDVSDLSPGSYVVVAVHDAGAGMPAEVAARAFEAFYTTKPAGKGSGLGLSVVHAFARHAGGTARIVSRPGEGTTVFLYLPRATATAKAAARTEAPRRPRAASPAAATMLLIEPEELVRQVTTDALTELGHRVLQAEDGEAALGLLRRGDPVDLVICPADMPNGTRGGDFAREARQIRGGLRVLLTADDPLAGDAAEGAESAVAVVTKPYGPKRLAAAIADLMSAG